MDGAHDMGGMHGFGPVDPQDERPYHDEWEARVHAISTAVAAPGGGRFALESLAPDVYLASSYYERWLQARINTLLAHGLIRREELDAAIDSYREAPGAALPGDDPERYEEARERMAAAREGRSERRNGEPPAAAEPRFGVGDSVTVKTIHPLGHTRLPRYVRGRQGEVIRVYRPQGFQDSQPLSDHVGPQPMYAVLFLGVELWGTDSEANSTVVLDMWEAYLE